MNRKRSPNKSVNGFRVFHVVPLLRRSLPWSLGLKKPRNNVSRRILYGSRKESVAVAPVLISDT
jgi:hypothetical protein